MTGIVQHCSDKLTTLRRIYALLPLLPTVVAGVLCALFYDYRPLILFALLISFELAAAFIAVPLWCERISYTRCKSRLRIVRGVIWRRISIISRSQVQYVTLRASPLERLLGLRTLIFHTPGGRVVLPGLEPDDAEKLREQWAGAHIR